MHFSLNRNAIATTKLNKPVSANIPPPKRQTIETETPTPMLLPNIPKVGSDREKCGSVFATTTINIYAFLKKLGYKKLPSFRRKKMSARQGAEQKAKIVASINRILVLSSRGNSKEGNSGDTRASGRKLSSRSKQPS